MFLECLGQVGGAKQIQTMLLVDKQHQKTREHAWISSGDHISVYLDQSSEHPKISDWSKYGSVLETLNDPSGDPCVRKFPPFNALESDNKILTNVELLYFC